MWNIGENYPIFPHFIPQIVVQTISTTPPSWTIAPIWSSPPFRKLHLSGWGYCWWLFGTLSNTQILQSRVYMKDIYIKYTHIYTTPFRNLLSRSMDIHKRQPSIAQKSWIRDKWRRHMYMRWIPGKTHHILPIMPGYRGIYTTPKAL